MANGAGGPCSGRAALLDYTAAAEHRGAVTNALRPYYALVPSCDPATARLAGLYVLTPVSVDADGALTAGSWVEQVNVEGCATSGVFKVYTLVQSATSAVVGALLPGTTQAMLTLQRDALPTARAFASAKLPAGRPDVRAIDTVFDGFGEIVNRDVPPPREARSWSERWIFSGCGGQTTVRMRFTPDQAGISFLAEI